MTTAAPWWLRVIGTVLGSLLVIYGLLTIPTDQKQYENYLVRWWMWIEERRETGLRWETAFLQVIATVTATGLDRLFGHRLLSLRAATTSVTLSMASMLLACGLVLPEVLSDAANAELGDRVMFLAVGSAFGIVGLWPLSGRLSRLGFTLAILLIIVFVGAIPVKGYLDHDFSYPSITLLAIVLSLLSDVMFVAGTRRVLHLCRGSKSWRAIIALLALNAVAAAVLVLVPMKLGFGSLSGDPRPTAIFGVLGLLNIFDGLIALLAIAVALIMLLHRILWPFIGRFLQVINDEHVLLKRWPLFFAGIGVLGATWPGVDLIGRYFGLHR